MNFIVIISDTLRRDHLGCYGNDWISTPHIDAFASGALVFDAAYAASFPTVPHRHDVLTGRFTATYMPWAPLPKRETVLAQVLSGAGYWTMMVSDTNHTLEHGYFYQRGFDGFEWIRGQENDNWKTCEPKLPACDLSRTRKGEALRHYRNRAHWRGEADTFVAVTMATACDWLETNRRRPFLLYVDTFDPHEPWDPPQHYVDMYDPGYTGEVIDYPRYTYVDGYLSEAELGHCRALYAGEVTLVDRWAGRLLEKIRDLGLLEDTMVIFTADHGFLHGEHGVIGKSLLSPETGWSYLPLYDEISHVPMIVHVPGAAAGRSDAMIQPPDIMPTILEAAGLEIPETVQGRSFLPIAQGKKTAHRERAFSFAYVGQDNTVATVTEGKWQATFWPARPMPTAGREDYAVDGLPKHADLKRSAREPLLYDLQADPEQTRNLAPDNPELLSRMRRHFVEFLEQCQTDAKIVSCWREA